MKDKYFPLFINLEDYQILVVGFGNIGARRIQVLHSFTKNITVIAPENRTNMKLTEDIQWIRKKIEETDLENFCRSEKKTLVLAATNCTEVNEWITKWCKIHQVMVNNCSDKMQCDFYFPGIACTEHVVAGITASGSNHALAKKVKNSVQKMLDEMT